MKRNDKSLNCIRVNVTDGTSATTGGKPNYRNVYDPVNGFSNKAVMKSGPNGNFEQIDVWAKDVTNPKSTTNWIVGDKSRPEVWNWWTNGKTNLTNYQASPSSDMGVLTNGTNTQGPSMIIQRYDGSGRYVMDVLKLRW